MHVRKFTAFICLSFKQLLILAWLRLLFAHRSVLSLCYIRSGKRTDSEHCAATL